MFDVTKNLKDATYVVIGLGVIAYQKAEEQGAQLRARLDDQRQQLDKQVTKQVEETRAQLTKLQERLPDRAKELVAATRDAAQQAQTQLRARLNGAAA